MEIQGRVRKSGSRAKRFQMIKNFDVQKLQEEKSKSDNYARVAKEFSENEYSGLEYEVKKRRCEVVNRGKGVTDPELKCSGRLDKKRTRFLPNSSS